MLYTIVEEVEYKVEAESPQEALRGEYPRRVYVIDPEGRRVRPARPPVHWVDGTPDREAPEGPPR